MKRTTYSIAAICDKAGRSVNQDNFGYVPIYPHSHKQDKPLL